MPAKFSLYTIFPTSFPGSFTLSVAELLKEPLTLHCGNTGSLCSRKMAAAKAAGDVQVNHIRKRKSNRIRAANKFLSNISLDGSSLNNSKKEKATTLSLDKDEEELLSHPDFLRRSLHERPKLFSSFSATNASEDEENIEPSPSACPSFQRNISLVEGTYNRTLKESSVWANNLIYTTNKPLALARFHLGHLPGKRLETVGLETAGFAKGFG